MMKKMKQIVIASALLATLGSISFALPVLAGPFDSAKDQACRGANLSNSDETCNSERAGNSASNTVENVINLLTVIVGIAAVIIIIINGLRFITANGDSGSISSARNAIIYALVGLIIAGFAQVIVRFVLVRI